MTKFYNANDGLTGRVGGPFLDQVEARQAEETRAIREGREPNFDNVQPYPGMQLVPESVLLQQTVVAAEQTDLTNFSGVTSDVVVEADLNGNGIPDSEEDESLFGLGTEKP